MPSTHGVRSSQVVARMLVALALGGGTACAPLAKSPAGASVGSRPGLTATSVQSPEVAAVLAASRLPDPIARPLPGDTMGVTISRLDNGLSVYISTDHTQPRISTRIVVRAGSRHDPADSTGLAHYLEHMLFKGTSKLGALDAAAEQPHLAAIEQLYARRFVEKDEGKRALLLAEIDRETQACAPSIVPQEMDRIYSAIGVQGINAFTGPDSTQYVADVPSNRFEAWARIEAERFLNPTFRLFLPELEAVYEEKNQSLDSPENRANEALESQLFPKHPYGTQTTIGTSEHLKNPAFQQMVAFFKRWYVPNNMAIVLAGDVDAATALPILQAQFGSWQPHPLPGPPPGEIAPLTGRSQREVVAEGIESVTMAWPAVPVSHPDSLAVKVLGFMAGSDQVGLLRRDLVVPQKVVEAGAFPNLMKEGGYFSAMATARDGQPLGEVEKLLLESLGHLKSGDFTQADLDALVLNVENDQAARLEFNDARVDRMATSFAEERPWPEVSSLMDQLRKVTRADVMRVANTYLTGNFAVVQRRRGKYSPPKIAKPKITPLPPGPDRRSAFADAVTAIPFRPLEPQWVKEGTDFQRAKLPAGGLLAARNTRNHLFAVSYAFDFGSRRFPLLCHAIDLQRKAGAGDLTADALQKRFFALGVRVDIACAPDGVTVAVNGADAKMTDGLALLDLWFRQARFSDDDVAKLLDNTLTARRNEMDDPRYAANALSEYAARGSDSAYLLAPSNETLRRARTAALKRLLADLPDHAHKTQYFGPRDLTAAARVVGFGRRHRKVEARPVVKYRQADHDTVFVLSREMAQSQLQLNWSVGRLARPNWALAQVLGKYLGGMSGSVFHEIRELRGLAYSADAGLMLGGRPRDESLLVGFMATQPDKANQALGRLVELLRKDPLNGGRLVEAKQAIEENYRATRVVPREVTSLVDSWDELGEKADYRPWMRAETAKVETAQLQAFLRKIAARPMVVAVTAEGEQVGLSDLGKIGRVKKIAVDQLFSYGRFPDNPATPRVVTSR
jgi:predicted Zn-dependent peptidase